MAADLFNEMMPAVWEATSRTRSLALILIPVFLVLSFGIDVIKSLFTGDSPIPEFKNLFSGLLIWIFCLNYTPVAKTLNSTMDLIVTSIDYGKDKATFDQAMKAKMDRIEEIESQIFYVKFSISPLLALLEKGWEGFGDVMGWIGQFLSDGATTIIFFVVFNISKLICMVMLVVGPLALAFQVAPYIGEGTIKGWLSSFISFKCWILTLNIIGLISTAYLTTQLNADAPSSGLESLQSGLQTIVINVVFIVLFIMTPAITNFYIRAAHAGLHTTMISAATTLSSVAGMGAAAGKMAGGAMISGAMKAGSAMVNSPTAQKGISNILSKIKGN